MICTDFEALLDDFVANKLSTDMSQSMEEHNLQCRDCTQSLAQHQTYRQALTNWQEPTLSAQQKERLLSLLNKQAKPQKIRSPYYGFASGFVAASFLAIGLFISSQFMNPAPQTDRLTLLEDDAHLSQEITLVINVANDMPGAELHLSLPEDLSIAGQEHLANVRLPVDLKKGKNTIVIPVQLEAFAMYAENVVVDASLIYKNSKKDFAFNLDHYLNQDSPQFDGDELIFQQHVALTYSTV